MEEVVFSSLAAVHGQLDRSWKPLVAGVRQLDRYSVAMRKLLLQCMQRVLHCTLAVCSAVALLPAPGASSSRLLVPGSKASDAVSSLLTSLSLEAIVAKLIELVPYTAHPLRATAGSSTSGGGGASVSVKTKGASIIDNSAADDEQSVVLVAIDTLGLCARLHALRVACSASSASSEADASAANRAASHLCVWVAEGYKELRDIVVDPADASGATLKKRTKAAASGHSVARPDGVAPCESRCVQFAGASDDEDEDDDEDAELDTDVLSAQVMRAATAFLRCMVLVQTLGIAPAATQAAFVPDSTAKEVLSVLRFASSLPAVFEDDAALNMLAQLVVTAQEGHGTAA